MDFKWIKWMFFCSVGVGFALWVLDLLCGGWWLWGEKEAVSQRLGNCFCDLESSG